MPSTLNDLRSELTAAGYYPEFVASAVIAALDGEELLDHLVQAETTFDAREVRRHVTVLLRTPTRLLVTHVDDEAGTESDVPSAMATTESIALSSIGSVLISQGAEQPQGFGRGGRVTTVNLAVCWGAMRRIDLEPAVCVDPACEADHGYTGTMAVDDIMMRVSAHAEGEDSVVRALRFGSALARAVAEA